MHRNRKCCYVAHRTDILTRREFTVTPSATAQNHKEYKNCHFKFLNFKFKFVYFLYIYIYIYTRTYIHTYTYTNISLCLWDLTNFKDPIQQQQQKQQTYGEVKYRFHSQRCFFPVFESCIAPWLYNCGINDKRRFIYYTGNVRLCHLVIGKATSAAHIPFTTNSFSPPITSRAYNDASSTHLLCYEIYFL